jgi:hypothetical protein
MKRFWIGRTLMALCMLTLALLLAYLGWISGAFSEYGLFGAAYSPQERQAAQFDVMVAGGLLVLAGLAFRRKALWVLLAAIIGSALGLGAFVLVHGWGVDLDFFMLVYPVMIGGYLLSRRPNS